MDSLRTLLLYVTSYVFRIKSRTLEASLPSTRDLIDPTLGVSVNVRECAGGETGGPYFSQGRLQRPISSVEISVRVPTRSRNPKYSLSSEGSAGFIEGPGYQGSVVVTPPLPVGVHSGVGIITGAVETEGPDSTTWDLPLLRHCPKVSGV